jgi:hypothetical protein
MRNDKTSFVLMNHSKDILTYPDGTGLTTEELPNQCIYLSSKNSLHAHTLLQSCVEIQRMDYHIHNKKEYDEPKRRDIYSRVLGSIIPKHKVPALFHPDDMDMIVALFKNALKAESSNDAYNEAVSTYMGGLLLQVRTLLADLIVTTDLMVKIVVFQESCTTLAGRIRVMPDILYNIHWKIDNEFELGTIPAVLPMRHEMGGTMVVSEIDTRSCIKILFVDCKFVNLYLQVWAKRLKSADDLPTVMVLDEAHPTRALAETYGTEIVEDVKHRFHGVVSAQLPTKKASTPVAVAKSLEPTVSVNELLAAFGENKPGPPKGSAAKGGKGGSSSAARGGGGGPESSGKKGTNSVLEVMTARAQQTGETPTTAPTRVVESASSSLSASAKEAAVNSKRAKTVAVFQQYKAKQAKQAKTSASNPTATVTAAATNKPLPNASVAAATNTSVALIPNASVSSAAAATNEPIPNASVSIAAAATATNEPIPNASVSSAATATNEPIPNASVSSAATATNEPIPNTVSPPAAPLSLVGRNARLQLQCLRFIPFLLQYVHPRLYAGLRSRGIPVPQEMIRCQIVGSAAVTMLEHSGAQPYPFTSDIDVRIVLNPSLSDNLFAYTTFFKLLEEATTLFIRNASIFPSTTELYGSDAGLVPSKLSFVYRTPEARALFGTVASGPQPSLDFDPSAPCQGVVLYPIGEAQTKALLKIQGRQQTGVTWEGFPVYDDIMDISTNALRNKDEWDALSDSILVQGDGWSVLVRSIRQLRRNIEIMKQSPEFTTGMRRLNRPKLDARLATLTKIERPEPRKRRHTLRRRLSTRRQSSLKRRRTLGRSYRFSA